LVFWGIEFRSSCNVTEHFKEKIVLISSFFIKIFNFSFKKVCFQNGSKLEKHIKIYIKEVHSAFKVIILTFLYRKNDVTFIFSNIIDIIESRIRRTFD